MSYCRPTQTTERAQGKAVAQVAAALRLRGQVGHLARVAAGDPLRGRRPARAGRRPTAMPTRSKPASRASALARAASAARLHRAGVAGDASRDVRRPRAHAGARSSASSFFHSAQRARRLHHQRQAAAAAGRSRCARNARQAQDALADARVAVDAAAALALGVVEVDGLELAQARRCGRSRAASPRSPRAWRCRSRRRSRWQVSRQTPTRSGCAHARRGSRPGARSGGRGTSPGRP